MAPNKAKAFRKKPWQTASRFEMLSASIANLEEILRLSTIATPDEPDIVETMRN